ncbi:MAG: hypothetical protein HZA54_13500, partial [Planctomycetes bacterium]|nr:hypothetical protein [Planctomycetota bacterium]
MLVFLALGREARGLPGGLAALPAPEPGVRLTAEAFAGAGAARGGFVASGMGPERAQLAAARLLEGARAAGVKLGAALSVGVAAALDPAWQ